MFLKLLEKDTFNTDCLQVAQMEKYGAHRYMHSTVIAKQDWNCGAQVSKGSESDGTGTLSSTFLSYKKGCLMNLHYLRMFLHPRLEFHEDVMAEGLAPTFLFAWTALQDC